MNHVFVIRLLALAFLLMSGNPQAQSSAFTYQGQLRQAGQPFTGTSDLQFRLYDQLVDGTQIAGTLGMADWPVEDGLFQVELDFGAGAFDGSARFLEVTVNGATLIPRQEITATPYALLAAGLMAGSVDGASIDPQEVQLRVADTCPSGQAIRIVNSNGSVVCQTTGWRLSGNAGTDPSTNFIGTSDATPLEIRTANVRSLRIEPSTALFEGAPITANVVAGSRANEAASGVRGGTISGGGLPAGSNDPNISFFNEAPNRVTDHYGTVGGGYANQAGDDDADPDSGGPLSTVSGGRLNVAGGFQSAIGGGAGNIASGPNSVISGGNNNLAESEQATVGGGFSNVASGRASVVGGGEENLASDRGTVVGGGAENVASGQRSVISGGFQNSTTETLSAIGGGTLNSATGALSFIGGGQRNDAGGGRSTVGGGQDNEASGDYSAVAGGIGNVASGVQGSIGGGELNVVSSPLGTIGGGSQNEAGVQSTIGGGKDNRALSPDSTIGGGTSNTVTAVIGTIGGGTSNIVSGSNGAISGGKENSASGSISSVGGGRGNTAGGTASVVAGGLFNTASGLESMVPGGRANCAGASFSWAGGRFAKVRPGTNSGDAGSGCMGIPTTETGAGDEGTFIWADSESATFISTAPNQFLIRAAGGLGLGTNAPATQLHVVKAINAPATPANHVALIENDAENTGSGPDVLALKSSAVTPNAATNYITFYNGNDQAVGAIEGDGSGGISFTSGGADFAEWLPKRDPDEDIHPGDVVGWHADGISHITEGALRVMAVSTRPVVAGNSPREGEEDDWAQVGFVGQVPVRVRGPVAAGDWIVASGDNDGAGIAVSAERLDSELLIRVVGQALGNASGEGVSQVNIVIGVGQGRVLNTTLSRLQMQNAALQNRLADIETQQAEKLASLRAELVLLRDLVQLGEGSNAIVVQGRSSQAGEEQ